MRGVSERCRCRTNEHVMPARRTNPSWTFIVVTRVVRTWQHRLRHADGEDGTGKTKASMAMSRFRKGYCAVVAWGYIMMIVFLSFNSPLGTARLLLAGMIF